MLQAPYNKLRYSVIGDNKAPTYFVINGENGDVKLNRSLIDDIDSLYTVNI